MGGDSSVDVSVVTLVDLVACVSSTAAGGVVSLFASLCGIVSDKVVYDIYSIYPYLYKVYK